MGLGPPPLGMSILVAGLIILTSFSVYYVISLAGEGQLHPNRPAGIRLAPLLKSAAAWRVGHAAALDVARFQIIGVIVLSVLTLLLSPSPWLYIAGLAASLIFLLVSSVLCVVRAVRAAKTAGAAEHRQPHADK